MTEISAAIKKRRIRMIRDDEPIIQFKEGDVRVIDLDPATAQVLLETPHPRQRKADEVHIEKIARALREGTFFWLGDPIRIDMEERLIDGQHRCHAVIRSGITIPNQIVVHVSTADAILYIDAVQKIRSPKVVQKMVGDRLTNTTVDAAIIFAHDNKFMPASRRSLSTPERLKIIKECPFLDELHTLHGKSNASGTRLTAGPLGIALAALRINREAAMQFFGMVAENRPYGDDGVVNPAELLARWMLRTGQDKGKRSGEAYIMESADKTARAWNAWARGRTLGSLAPSKDGKVPALQVPVKAVIKSITK